ncbi:MAG: methyl-accepting chemotaxis protein [Aulosira sp. ZfuVER01]|nr:methyl-accepting chemotaxis protein [Aulosira sp. ZfuVER01]MDZ7997023.1 methyl-accepting chemotaxis protein [Aulosira sp. DedVER01a]MDZ8053052.1 methyl-accepting chemotaxis protein [Aulosira sp. ZfuCHP01]
MFENWKLKDRTLLGFSIPTVLIFIFSIIVYIASNQAGRTYRQVGISNDAIIGTDDMALGIANMDRSIRRYVTDTQQNKDALARYAKSQQDFQAGFKVSNDVVEDAVQKKRLQTMLSLMEELDDYVKQLIKTSNLDQNKTAISEYMAYSRKITDEFYQINDDFNNREKEIMGQSIVGTKAMLNLMSFLAVLVSISTLAIAVFVTLLIAKSLGTRVTTAVKVAEQISLGDLTSSIGEKESTIKDEIGQILEAFKNMMQKLSSLIRQVQNSGIQVTTSATQIAASGKQLEATLAEQVASTNQVTATAKEIAATSKELVNTMEQVVAMSQITTQAASISQTDLVRMEGSMRQLAEATNSIASRLGVISEKANNINNIVLTITKVADQTNLLSLNAAIEAEKAGEYGLGFAVVAREIRRLADQTAVATLDIEQMVKQMQSSVSTGVMEMDKFAAEVGRSVADVGNISTQIGQIITKVQDLNPRFELVNKGMETQSIGAQQISDAMLQLSSTSLQTADSLREINSAIAQLNQVSQGLRQEISRFKVKVEDDSSISNAVASWAT